ncbi:YkgJ family cysteine cluster protein [Dehalogenimonas etheniformans]|nr:YkgJ family cysteine cluster protein [Dehalogenimonas etheniformans]QNT76108.1 YkgJ family cysteine cluster protein [Dehalogenimonas etheniformans]
MTDIFKRIGVSDADLAKARELAAGHFVGSFGEKYKKYVTAVWVALLETYPPAKELSPTELVDIISVIDIIAADSRGIMKRLKEACTCCGWCCSQTKRIEIDEEDAVRISRKLKQRRDDLFAFDGKEWTIKRVNPCGWWNPRNGRCQIYSDRPSTCRVWPLGLTEGEQKKVQPMHQCQYAVMVLVNKVIWTLEGDAKSLKPSNTA